MVDAKSDRITAFTSAELIVNAAQRRIRAGAMQGIPPLDTYLEAQIILSQSRAQVDPFSENRHLAQAEKLTLVLHGSIESKAGFCVRQALKWADIAKKHQKDAVISPINDEIAAGDRAMAVGWLIWEVSLFIK